MTNVEHAEGGTVVQPDEAGIIFSAKGQLRLLMPRYSQDEQLPKHFVIIAAIFARCHTDPDWLEEQLKWFKKVRH
jgi:hypothetical protein